MGDVIRDLEIVEPGTLKVGNRGEATALQELIAGSFTLNLGSIAAVGVTSSASAVQAGMTADHKVLIMPAAWASTETVRIAAAAGIAGGIQVTAINTSASAIDPTSQTFNFFAWR